MFFSNQRIFLIKLKVINAKNKAFLEESVNKFFVPIILATTVSFGSCGLDMFLGFETKIGKAENFVQFKMVAAIVDFPLFVPLFCPTKISLGRFGPIFPWSGELTAAILEPERIGI